MDPIKVLVVDDSALIRQILTELLRSDPEIVVVGTANDPFAAREKIKQLRPDVLTLDVEMPRMDGLTFLKNLMRLRPMPVIMFSSLTERGADVTLRALELGAVDFVAKPKLDIAGRVEAFRAELIDKIKVAHRARPALLARIAATASAPSRPDELTSLPFRYRTTDVVLAIGASTGGTEAIKDVLLDLPADAPGIVIAQHIPALFSASFARRLNDTVAMTVVEAQDGMIVRPGHVMIAPGGRHLTVRRDGARYACRLDDTDPVNRHRPSVDVLFHSVAVAAGSNAVAALLTGMGEDGARGLLALRQAGARTLIQDEASSVVWGMPGSAARMGAADEVVPLAGMAHALLRATRALDSTAVSDRRLQGERPHAHT